MQTEKELRESIRRELLGLVESTEQLQERKRKRFRGKQEIDPPISDLTKEFLDDESQYKTAIRNALRRGGKHIPIAAKELGVSVRTLQRHIDRNFNAGELDDLLAGPGPDLEWDLETGKRVPHVADDKRRKEEKRREERAEERRQDFKRRQKERERRESGR